MVAFHGGDRVFGHHGWWWGFFGGVVPFLFIVAFIGLAVWAVLRLTRGTPFRALAPASAPAVRLDGALEEVRLRYARGEMSREEFLQRARDLGTAEPHPGEPSPPEAG
jgi:putative membrane protein